MNFLYCFDSNYNLQGLSSINSLICQSDSKLSIYIIHENPDSIVDKIKKINKKNIHNIEIYKFINQNIKFPRVDGTHVSDATYYRLFISEYLPEDIDFITYIDADILCLKEPTKSIQTIIHNMIQNNSPIAALTESKGNKDDIERLNLNQIKYFNAGVLVINMQLWNKKSEDNEFIDNLNYIKDKVLWWDQDVLNFTFDGNYTELNMLLNYQIEPNKSFDTKKIEEEVIFLHYLGNTKPWSFNGLKNNYSKYYQEHYRKIEKSKYHLVSKNFKSDYYEFLKILIFNFKEIEYKTAFVYESKKSLLKNLRNKLYKKS
tara:strand:- start:291 stop:1238 length:948 start_codon:yes stop_codon:yes gene_type:complete